MNRYIGVRPVGGLGNQLFIYAAGAALANSLGATLLIRTDWYSKNNDRRLEISAFEYSGDLAVEEASFDRLIRSRPLPTQIRESLARRKGIDLLIERSHAFAPIPKNLTPPIELRGYFQSWRYFTEIEEELTRQLSTLVNPSPAVGELLDRLESLGRWTAVHVRCGDFLDPTLVGLHGTTRLDYYERAIAQIDHWQGRLPIVVFSDDPKCAKTLLGELGTDTHFLQLDDAIRPMDWLYMLSQATSLVTANSSFSWWGAWLAQQRGAWPIVCPRPWFADPSIPEQDLVPLDWITVGRDYRG